MPPALELAGIHKRFGSVQALRGADFVLAPGEVQALLGENGAGKTTLMNVAFGLTRPDAGRILIDAVHRTLSSPGQARRLGIGMVHQHFTAVPALTVAENIALGAGWSGKPRLIESRAAELSHDLGLPLDPGQRAGRLSVALKQRLEIVKALASEPRVLLLDEPTAVLAPAEAEELLQFVRRFALKGGSAVVITHKLDEALRAADRVTVLRQGVVTHTGPVAAQTVDLLARAMIGAAPDLPHASSLPSPREVSRGGSVLVRVEALEVSRESGYGIAVRRAALTVRSGEIVGVAAVEGNGHRELLRAVAGRLSPLRGRLEVASPIGFIPEDRTSEGLISELTLTENVALGLTRDAPWIRHGRISWREARSHTAQLIQEFEIVASGPDAKGGSLSGGNQQKLVLARELSRAPAVLVAENPTRGLDVSSTAAVHARIRATASAGGAVLFHSTDLDEVLQLAHRVVVMARGVLSEVPPTASRAEIGTMMLRAEPPA